MNKKEKINTLKMVTWEIDLTQFLVLAETNDEAIQFAIEANKEVDKNYTYDPNDRNDLKHLNDVKDPSTYTVEDMDAIRCLDNILRRNDCGGIYGNAIVFWG